MFNVIRHLFSFLNWTLLLFVLLFSSGLSQSPSNKSEMILIPQGEFLMGGTDESDQNPTHIVFLDSYFIDKTEVTQKAFKSVMGFNPSKNSNPNLPVESVSWYEANEFCRDQYKRLPTEAEWEKAARGKSTTPFYWGKGVPENFTWFLQNSNKQSHFVATKQPNSFGIFDMAGNVWEWVSDWYAKDYYTKSPYRNPKGPKKGEFKVQRGGSWSNPLSYHKSSYRMVYGPLGRDEFNGFRCAKSI